MAELHRAPVSPPTGGWAVIGASAVGAGHPPDRSDNQDAWHAERGGAGELVVAVADGHGDRRHFRSGRGSRLAVEVACRQGLRWLLAHHGAELDSDALERSVYSDLLPPLVADWAQAVLDDVADDPFTDKESTHRRPHDDALIAYGSTLLLAIADGRKVILAQIGDGDILAVGADGRATKPVPYDPSLDGRRTTSLCQPDALAAFRAAVVDRDASPVLLLLLATDGYGNAQTEEEWEPQVGRDFARFIADQGVAWVADHLEGWAAACASLEGSGDDVTVALLIDEEIESGSVRVSSGAGEISGVTTIVTQPAPPPPPLSGGQGSGSDPQRRWWRPAPEGRSSAKRRL
jgi:serine/threonine protein phosphatase PrpC